MIIERGGRSTYVPSVSETSRDRPRRDTFRAENEAHCANDRGVPAFLGDSCPRISNKHTARTHARTQRRARVVVSSPSSSIALFLLFQRGQRGRPAGRPGPAAAVCACAHDEDGRGASERPAAAMTERNA